MVISKISYILSLNIFMDGFIGHIISIYFLNRNFRKSLYLELTAYDIVNEYIHTEKWRFIHEC